MDIKTKQIIKTNPHSNEDYFKIIDKEKSYILGLIASDGYVIDNKQINKKGRNYWGIQLQEDDKEILEKINQLVQNDKSIYFRKKRKENWKNSYTLTVRSNIMVDDLKSIGITPRKSFSLKIPEIFQKDEKLFWHFLRGYFDGDGCITSSIYNKIEQFKIYIVGSFDTCQYVSNFLHQKYQLGSGKIYKKENIFCFYVSGNEKVKQFYSLLYKDAELFIKRKKEKMFGVFK